MANKRFYQTPGGIKQYNLPDLVQAQVAPTTSDRYQVGTLWVNEATGNAYQLTQYSGGNPVWSVLGGATGAVATLTGDSGVATPVAGNINILTGANLTTLGAADDVTISLDTTISGLTSVTSTSFVTGSATEGVTYTGNSITATGSDAAINLELTPKGTGDVNVTVGDLVDLAGDIIATRSDAGVDVTLEATNSDNTNGASNAFVELATGGASSGDAGVRFQVSGVATNWSAGLDNSDSDAFVISGDNAIGTANAMRIDHTTLDIQFPGGNVDITAGNLTVSGSITADDIVENITGITFSQSPILQSAANTGAAPSGATGDVNVMMIQGGLVMEQFILGAGQTIIAPRMTSTGLLTSLDLTNAEGAEYNFGAALSNSPFAFTIGTSPAFYIELAVNAADVGGLDPFVVGFRKAQANAATFTDYTDFATIGARATTAADVIVLQTDLNNAGETITNTTDAWTDGQTKTLKVLVSAAGVVTYTIDGLAPTVTAAFTFDNADVVVPFIRHEFGATTPGAINWVSLAIGFQ